MKDRSGSGRKLTILGVIATLLAACGGGGGSSPGGGGQGSTSAAALADIGVVAALVTVDELVDGRARPDFV